MVAWQLPQRIGGARGGLLPRKKLFFRNLFEGLKNGVGLVGYDFWGPNLPQDINEVAGAQLLAVCDQGPKRLDFAKPAFPQMETTSDYQSLLDNPENPLIAIATLVFPHIDPPQNDLRAGEDFLVEKPLTNTVTEGRKLIVLAPRPMGAFWLWLKPSPFPVWCAR